MKHSFPHYTFALSPQNAWARHLDAEKGGGGAKVFQLDRLQFPGRASGGQALPEFAELVPKNGVDSDPGAGDTSSLILGPFGM